MSKLRSAALLVVLCLTLAAADSFAISRTSRSLNYLQVFGSYNSPMGEVEFFNLPDYNGNFDADDVYESGGSFGIGLGQVRAGRMHWGLDFRYTKHELQDVVENNDVVVTGIEGLGISNYDLDLSINYYLSDMAQIGFSPFVGLGVTAGIMSAGYDNDDFDNETEMKALAGLNFGFDFRLAQNADGSQISLVSLNRYDIMASDERPRYLNLGLALRYYVRP